MNKVAGFVKTAETGSLVSEKPMATKAHMATASLHVAFGRTARRLVRVA